jgi:[acyl-carrier-protein] S-malonyltransferase
MADSPVTAFVFPGQGAQFVGMGASARTVSAAARAVFEEANEVLGFDLSRIIFEGPAEELVSSHNAQPAILTVSVALMRAVGEQLGSAAPHPAFVAGHSLGEYTALVAAGVLDFATALRLVRRRGELMQEAAEATPSGMAALIGLQLDGARQACEGTGAQVANANSAEQIVIAGPTDALAAAIERSKEAGARRALPLEVAGAFHTEIMRPAQVALDALLSDAEIHAPTVPVVANTTAKPLTTVEELRAELADQLCGCVYWQQSVEFMGAQGVTQFVEIGPGKVLSGLVKRIVPGAVAVPVEHLDALSGLT